MIRLIRWFCNTFCRRVAVKTPLHGSWEQVPYEFSLDWFQEQEVHPVDTIAHKATLKTTAVLLPHHNKRRYINGIG